MTTTNWVQSRYDFIKRILYYFLFVYRYIQHALGWFYAMLGLIPVLGPVLQLGCLILGMMIFYFNCPLYIRSAVFWLIRCLFRVIIWLTPGADQVFYELRDVLVSLIRSWVAAILTWPIPQWSWPSYK